jgi:hypothetical protein
MGRRAGFEKEYVQCPDGWAGQEEPQDNAASSVDQDHNEATSAGVIMRERQCFMAVLRADKHRGPHLFPL